MTNDLDHDPVCSMPVNRTAAAATVQYEGRTYAFCSELCRARFVQRPMLYVKHDVARAAPLPNAVQIAYFSMEIALESSIPTYSGGLGVLAGDTLRSMRDLGLPAVAVSLVYRQGYVRQSLAPDGTQHEAPASWDPAQRMVALPHRVQVDVAGRTVHVRAFQYDLTGEDGRALPVLLLDTDLPENNPEDRRITDQLYGGDSRYRLTQEMILGIAGMRMLQAAGYNAIRKLHLNEGHAALAALELLRSEHANPDQNEWNFDAIRRRCVFTTHTPVPAGHDHFDWSLVAALWREQVPMELLRMLGGQSDLSMTALAINLSGFVNGVARQHRAVTQQMFPGYDIRGVTNGVHSLTWTSGPLCELYDDRLPGWRADPATLRNALSIPANELWNAHSAAKAQMLELITQRTGRILRADVLTLGFARRVTAYKRTDLIFSDLERLRGIASRHPLQIVFAGKAHPRDEPGKQLIRRVFAAGQALSSVLPVVWLEDYDMDIARSLVAGCDVWLNTPEPPLEASGTSGMKAAHNGVPSLSTLDGWWLEGHVEGVTGWSIGARDATGPASSQRDADALYAKLEQEVARIYYGERSAWMDIMRHVVALNASFFNTHRMLQQYSLNAYL